MATTSDLIHAARRWLQSSGRPEFNKLTAAETNSDTVFALDFALGSVQPGAVLCVDLEEVYCWSVSSPNATVQRGWNGSTAATHSLGALVEVNPLFSSWRIFNEINAEINSISPTIYQVKTVSVTSTTAWSYNLASDVIDVLTVQYQDIGPSGDWPLLTRWAFLANQDTSSFASGRALTFYEMPVPGRTLRITYAAPLVPLATISDNVESVSGLPSSAIDIPVIGAAARLLSSREARRSQVDAQPEARQAQDVPPGTAGDAAGRLFAIRDRRIREEAIKLGKLFPTRIRRAV